METEAKKLYGKAKRQDKQDFLIERDESYNRRTIIGVTVENKEEKEWHVMLGKFRLNEETHTIKEEAEEDAKKLTLERIMQVIQIMIDENQQNQEQQNKELQN